MQSPPMDVLGPQQPGSGVPVQLSFRTSRAILPWLPPALPPTVNEPQLQNPDLQVYSKSTSHKAELWKKPTPPPLPSTSTPDGDSSSLPLVQGSPHHPWAVSRGSQTVFLSRGPKFTKSSSLLINQSACPKVTLEQKKEMRAIKQDGEERFPIGPSVTQAFAVQGAALRPAVQISAKSMEGNVDLPCTPAATSTCI